MRKPLVTIALVLLLAALAVAGSAVASSSDETARAAKTRVVKVGDDYFSKRSLTVNRNDIVEWRWTPDVGQSETAEHNVTGSRRGTTAFASKDLRAGKYRKKFRKGGRSYRVICTLHPVRMTMKLVVRK